jgi:16S rRNA (guanine(966)-N(2))-methyltransferase RsmD
MRVISGYLRSRKLIGYDLDSTRPTMDKVKESLFAMIQEHINESNCLDLFAGSGSLGIEAISNYANHCYFVDNNKKAIEVLNSNIDNLNIRSKTTIINKDYSDALKYFLDNNIKFDVIFLDPPYEFNVYSKITNYIVDNNLINDEGIIVCEYSTDINCSSNKLKLLKTRDYGNKKIDIYVYNNM